jgi:methionyl-tRNA synthetase
LRPFDEAVMGKIREGFNNVGELLEAVKLKAAQEETMRLATEVNIYLDNAPWFGQTIKEDKPSAATTMYTAIWCINNLKVLFAPFLPHISEQVHHLLGFDARLMGDLKISEYEEKTRSHLALTYDGQDAIGTWEPTDIPAGQQLREPKPLVKKLGPEVVEEELAALGIEG